MCLNNLMKILLVEDSVQLSKALSTILKRNSYVVDAALDGEEALLFLRDYTYDVIILDIMLPKVNGIEVLRRARANHIDTPIIMLTAKSTIEDKVAGLDAGADDYLPKPFLTEELLARIRALLRRKSSYSNDSTIEFGDLVLDEKESMLSCGENKVALMNKEAQIMRLLMEGNGRIVSMEEISSAAWDADSSSSSENVWAFVSYLRKKVEGLGSSVRIKSIRYQGYRLEVSHD